jgi:hypothetical protein
MILTSLSILRFSSFINLDNSFIFNSGIYLGAICGILLHHFKNQEELFKNFLDKNFILFSFFIFLIVERFLIYYNFPLFNGFTIQETMYLPNLSSKEAFASSMNLSIGLLFPLLYIFIDKTSNKKKYELEIAFLLVLLVNFFIIQIQSFYPNFLTQNTNLSLEVYRYPGLFRDSGSSSFILGTISVYLLNFFLKDIYLKRKLEKFYYSFVLLFLMIIFWLGKSQGKAYWFILLFGFIYFALELKNKKLLYSAIIFIILFSIFAYFQVKVFSDLVHKIFTSIQLGFSKESILSFDPPRYYLNLMSLEIISHSPFLGEGIGSFIVSLYDSSLALTNPKNIVDNPGSFFLGIISEIGILGTLVLIINLPWNQKLFLLIPGLCIGYQISHLDSATFIIFYVFYSQRTNSNKWQFFTSMSLLCVFMIHLFYSFINKSDLVRFREKELFSKQLLAFQKNRSTDCHLFKGKLIWKISNSNDLNLNIFLDSSTSKKEIILSYYFLDANKNRQDKNNLLVTKEKNKYFRLNKSEDSVYLIIEEMRKIPYPFYYDLTPFCINVKNFTSTNEIRDYLE